MWLGGGRRCGECSVYMFYQVTEVELGVSDELKFVCSIKGRSKHRYSWWKGREGWGWSEGAACGGGGWG